MDIYEYLIRDHRRVTRQMDELLDINLQWVEQRMFEDIKAELLLHTEAEERVFYRPIAEKVAARIGTLDIGHSVDDHVEIRTLLDRLTEEGITSPKWMVMFGQLTHAVEHHVAEEESMIFPLARQVFTLEQAETLPRQMDAAKQQIKESRALSLDHVADS